MELAFELDPGARASATVLLQQKFWLLDDATTARLVKEVIDTGFLEDALGNFGLL